MPISGINAAAIALIPCKAEHLATIAGDLGNEELRIRAGLTVVTRNALYVSIAMTALAFYDPAQTNSPLYKGAWAGATLFAAKMVYENGKLLQNLVNTHMYDANRN